MKYYVVADVHGFYTILKDTLTKAGFFDETEPCKLILCGDALDRGEEAVEMVNFIMELMKEDKLIFVRGNHEDLLLRCIEDVRSGGAFDIASGGSYHYSNGTWDTMLRLSGMEENQAIRFPRECAARVERSDFCRKVLDSTVNYFETPNYIFVHGWLPCREEGFKPYKKLFYLPDWREADDELWWKARWINGMEAACKRHILETGKTVVCGHFHTSYGHAVIENKGSEWDDDADFSPFYADGIIAIDACTAASGMMNCIIIED